MTAAPPSHNLLFRSAESFQSSDLDRARAELITRIPLRSLDFATTDRRLDVRLQAVRLPHLTVMSLAYGGDMRAVVDTASSFVVHVPLSGSVRVGDGRLEFVCTPELGAVSSPDDPVTTRWEPRASAVILRIERTTLEHELADATGGAVDDLLRFQPGLDLFRESVRGWFDLTMLVASELDAKAGLLDHPLIAPHIERVLLRGLLLCQPNTYTERLHDDRRSGRPEHVVAAMRFMEDRPHRSFTTTSLAREVGVSSRALQEGFRKHLGVTPMQFLRDVRLRRVRLDLLAAGAENPTTISETAFRWGFTHLGRFASYYRARYGESPSQTLRNR